MQELRGVVFTGLKRYVDERIGRGVWRGLLHESGLGDRIYFAVGTYDGADAIRLLTAAATRLKQPPDIVLEDFGEYLALDLLRSFPALAPARWNTLRVLQNSNRTLNRFLLMRNEQAQPLEFECERTARDAVELRFHSIAKTCSLAIGMIQGVALHYGQSVRISDVECVASGDAACKLRVRAVR